MATTTYSQFPQHDALPRTPASTRPGSASHYSAPSRKPGGGCFLLAVIVLIFFIYCGYLTILLLPMVTRAPSVVGVFVFFFFHLAFGLMLLAFCKAVGTDPGQVPPNWGFYMGDESKRRRYCKVCNVWKPDRTHHCSACGRCVLNMDHHCPWINNCVGFYNRKFFIQLLLYALICLIFVFVHCFHYVFVESLVATTEYSLPPSPHASHANPLPMMVLEYAYVCLILFLSMILIFALIPFTRFHLHLVLKNSTTIENMDQANRDRNRYDLGVGRNIEQVFGANPCCWLMPCHAASSRPIGDGVRWNMHYMVASELDGV